jgi:hypothetical protein
VSVSSGEYLQHHPHMSAWQHTWERRHDRQLTGSGCGRSNRAGHIRDHQTSGPPDGRCCQTGRIRRRCSGPTRGYPERKLSGASLDLPVRRAGSCDAHSTSPIACQAERGSYIVIGLLRTGAGRRVGLSGGTSPATRINSRSIAVLKAALEDTGGRLARRAAAVAATLLSLGGENPWLLRGSGDSCGGDA